MSKPYNGERSAGTVRAPLTGNEVRIAESWTENLVPTGQVGTIEVRGDCVFKAHCRMP